MKTIKLSFLLCVATLGTFAQNFTWVKGSNTAGLVGVYGTQGVSAPGNNPGGRHGCATWTDVNGNLWLFGGEGFSTSSTESLLNDLWKYNPVTNEWTWIRGSNGPDSPGSYGAQGVASPLNDPSAREFMISWTDASGNFWLYGGDGVSQSYAFMADLWKYDPTTNEWTWMKGPNTPNMISVYGTQNVSAAANYPGSRELSTAWTDNTGKLWLFGGRGFNASTTGTLNDLWRYDPITNEWTYVSGTTGVNQSGVYGTLGLAAATNYPGAHSSSSPFISPQGNLILCAGHGFASTASQGYLNDMWEFDLSTNNWKWLSGSNLPTALASYGTLGVASATTLPGGRMSAAAWTDISGNYWMFGGNGLIATSTVDQLNDLFMYNPVTNQWTWVKGSNQSSQNGTYGTQGVSAAANMPGSRYYNTWWKNTSTGALWLFGGLGYDVSMNMTENMNDLWKLTLPCNPDSAAAQISSPICSGNTITLNAYNLYPAPVSWFSSPTSTSTIANGPSFVTPALSATGSSSVYTYYAGSANCSISPRAMVNVTVLPLPVVNITGPASLCPMQSGTITATGAQTYTWNSGLQSSTTTLLSGASMSVIGTGSNGCANSSNFSMGVYPLPNLSASSSNALSCAGEPITITASGAATYTWSNAYSGSSISVSPTITSTYIVDGLSENGCAKSYTFTQFVAACVGIDALNPNTAIVSLYPNPNTGSFIVSVNQKSTLSITNSLGQKIIEQSVEIGNQHIHIDVPKGIYMCALSSDNTTYFTRKLIIEN